MEARSILEASPLFAGLAPDVLDEISAISITRVISRNGFAWLQGDPGATMFLLVDGWIKVAMTGPEGDELILDVQGAGEIAGHPAAFAGAAPRATSGQAVGTANVLAIQTEPFIRLVERTPDLAHRMLALLANYVRTMGWEWAQLAYLDVPGRVARKLLDLSDRYGEPVPGGVRIRIPLSQRTLASMIAASRENVNRALSRFAESGAIVVEDGSIVVVDAEGLRRRSRHAPNT